MATATLERPTTETAQNGKQAKSNFPVLDWEINQIASQNGLQPDFIATQISNSGGMVARVGDVLVTTREAWNQFVDSYLAQIKEGLLGAANTAKPATPRSTATKLERKTNTRKPARTPATKTIKPKAETNGAAAVETDKGADRPKFKSFKVSNSYSRTLDAFLSAQKWDSQKRIEVIEGISNLSATPTDDSNYAEQCLKRIVNAHPANRRKDARQKLIDAARSMTGSLKEVTE